MDKQQLNVTLLIPIPEDMILIKKVEYEELKAQSLPGQYWTMKDLEKHIGKEWRWIKDNILYPSEFRKILDVQNGGFVYYPKGRGKSWIFLASKMSRFLEDNFHTIFTR